MSRADDATGQDARSTADVLAALQQAIDSVGTDGQTHGAHSSAPLTESVADEQPDPIADDPEYKRAKKRALNMLAARDHSSSELREKLLGREHPEDIVDALIERLQSSKLLDDANFAHSFVRAKREQRKLSQSALRRELKKKGIDGPIADDALGEIDDEWDLAYAVAEKKAASTRDLPYETRQRRILSMLARRGFPSGLSFAVARQVLDTD